MNYYMLSNILTATSGTGNISDMANGVSTISEAISKYGPLVVIMAVFVIIFILMVILVLRSNSKLMNGIIAREKTKDEQQQDIISKFVESSLENFKDQNKNDMVSMVQELQQSIEPLKNVINKLNEEKKEDSKNDYHKDLVGAYIDVNIALKDASRSALNALNCERVAIYIFHNGNTSMHGLPFFKMSCIHEWTTHGSNTLRGKSHMDIPLHLFNDFIEVLWKDGIYKTQDIDKTLETDPSMTEFTEYSHVKALYMVAIKNSDDNLAGFVVSEFENIDTFEDDESRDAFVHSVLHDMAIRVAPIVANKYVYKPKNK